MEYVWLDSDILRAINYKQRLWSLCLHSPKNGLLKLEFKMARNKVNALIRTTKIRHLKTQSIEADLNARKTWAQATLLRSVKRQQNIDDLILQSFFQ